MTDSSAMTDGERITILSARIDKLEHQNELMLQLLFQYMDDMRYPPSEDSRERRLARISEVVSEIIKK